jgi:saccharopine dehydrogenase-like NADP-dependent oxidoreductase
MRTRPPAVIAVATAVADIEDCPKLINLLNRQFAVLNAGPFHLTTGIAEAARAAGAHHLDLTEDVARARRVRQLAVDAGIAFIPRCGLAPGFVSIVALEMTMRFKVLDSVKLRIGAVVSQFEFSFL